MMNLSLRLILSAMGHTSFWVGSLIVASLNMLINIFFDALFGYKENTKIRGWRAE